jgi:hypothetical protein
LVSDRALANDTDGVVHRFLVGINSEVERNTRTTKEVGELFIEQAYFDISACVKGLTLRIGRRIDV